MILYILDYNYFVILYIIYVYIYIFEITNTSDYITGFPIYMANLLKRHPFPVHTSRSKAPRSAKSVAGPWAQGSGTLTAVHRASSCRDVAA